MNYKEKRVDLRKLGKKELEESGHLSELTFELNHTCFGTQRFSTKTKEL